MKPTIFLSALFASLLAGCASVGEVRHVLTGDEHPPIQADAVKVTQIRPVLSEPVATFMASAPGSTQDSFDAAVKATKEDAAKLGANGLTVTHWKYIEGRETYLDGIEWWLPDFAK
jgi:hypothetical protein